MTPTDDFDRALLDEIGNNKALQLALLEKARAGSKGYSIPTGGAGALTQKIYNMGLTGDRLKKLERFLEAVLQNRGIDLVRIFCELQDALLAKEACGEELDEIDKTLRDIDLSSLIVTAIARHDQLVSPRALEKGGGDK